MPQKPHFGHPRGPFERPHLLIGGLHGKTDFVFGIRWPNTPNLLFSSILGKVDTRPILPPREGAWEGVVFPQVNRYEMNHLGVSGMRISQMSLLSSYDARKSRASPLNRLPLSFNPHAGVWRKREFNFLIRRMILPCNSSHRVKKCLWRGWWLQFSPCPLRSIVRWSALTFPNFPHLRI